MIDILIADAGSSKTDWSILTGQQSEPIRFRTSGINPAHDSASELEKILHGVKDEIKNHKISTLYFFGAGCATDSLKNKIELSLKEALNIDTVFVNNDLIGAGKALFRDESGLVCILGTGSATGYYSKESVLQRIPSLGFILGDEGSGSALGKKLLNAVYKKSLEEDIINRFLAEYNLSLNSIIEKTYTEPKPAKFLASFTPFLLNHIDRTSIYNLVSEEIRKFFIKNVICYPLEEKVNIGMVGSIAYNFRDIIQKEALNWGLKIDKIIPRPMEELEKYYLYK